MTHQNADESRTQRVDTLLTQMRTLCAQIDAIGEKQQQLLDADELEAFVESLNSRNPMIESLAAKSSQVEQFLECDGVGADLVSSARAQLDEMSTTVTKILKRDAEQQVVVERRRDELSKQLSGVGNGRTAVRAYGGAQPQPKPNFQDREG
ncbi:MAG: flagellar protein FliT [Phycisphaerales bacterium]|nr:flagellar protein FliT [Phycisphaerales bacterium]